MDRVTRAAVGCKWLGSGAMKRGTIVCLLACNRELVLLCICGDCDGLIFD
jgi:hypothetical protein